MEEEIIKKVNDMILEADICKIKKDGTNTDFFDNIDEIELDENNSDTFLKIISENLYLDGIKYLIKKGSDIYCKDEEGHDALYHVLLQYNFIMEKITCYCDNINFVEEIIKLRKNPDLNVYLTVHVYELFEELSKFLDTFNALKIIDEIVDETFKGKIPIFEDIINEFIINGYDLESNLHGKTLIEQSTEIYIPFFGTGLHLSSDIHNFYGLQYLIRKGVSTEPIKDFIENSRYKKIFKKWISGEDQNETCLEYINNLIEQN